MRPHGQISAAGLIIVALIAVLGFAAVSADPPAALDDDLTSGTLATPLEARVAAAGLAASMNPEIERVVEPAPAEFVVTPQAASTAEVAPATTTTTAPAPTTTTTAAPAPTTTTAAPATTTTAPPPTTTAAPTTTAVPTTTTSTEGTTTTTAPPPPGGARDVEEWRSLVEQYFPAEHVEGALTVMECESRGDPSAYNPSSGASGLFQFIPSTWAWAAPAAGFGGASPFDPAANIATTAWVVQRSIDQGKTPWSHWTCKP